MVGHAVHPWPLSSRGEAVHLVVDLLLGDRAGALAHLLLHLLRGGFILLLQLLLLLAVLRIAPTRSMRCLGTG